jgi:hypothetical protein
MRGLVLGFSVTKDWQRAKQKGRFYWKLLFLSISLKKILT